MSADKSTLLKGEALKWGVLLFLVFQNSAASLVMRYVRSVPGHSDWNSQTGVIMQESIKFGVCFVIILLNDGFQGLTSCFSDPKEAIKTMVPAVAYLIQNNLQYVATSHLTAPSYAVLYQLKIVSTAFLSVLLLGRELKLTQWIAICVLTGGVALVSLSKVSDDKLNESSQGNFMFGLIAILSATLCSGFAGVFFEKMLKGTKQSMWQRNLVLALFSIVVGLGGLYMGPGGQEVAANGFFYGYTTMVWTSIANNALGGLLIAAVIKYADNILKNFATGGSIILTTIVSCLVFAESVSTLFMAGVFAVCYSVALFGGAVRVPFLSAGEGGEKKKA